MTAPKPPHKRLSLADLLRAEGNKPYQPPLPAPQDAADDLGPLRGPLPTKQQAMAAALYDLVIDSDTPPSARVAGARLILEYCEGRPAQVQVNIAQHRPGKTYVVVSPDDWPVR